MGLEVVSLISVLQKKGNFTVSVHLNLHFPILLMYDFKRARVNIYLSTQGEDSRLAWVDYNRHLTSYTSILSRFLHIREISSDI